jgi:hypothetical protein
MRARERGGWKGYSKWVLSSVVVGPRGCGWWVGAGGELVGDGF